MPNGPDTEPMEFIDLAAQRLRLGARLEEAILRVVRHGRYIMGPEIEELEHRLAAFCGARHALVCASGTDALALGLMAKGISPGDAVFLPAFTFAATAEVVAWLGATPVFVDVFAHSFNMDPASLDAAIAAARPAGLRPAAVIPVDLFGLPAEYEPIEALAREHGLWILADAAQSFGAACNGRKVGTLGAMTATSFFPAKPLGCYGDGGAVFTDDDTAIEILRSLRVHGQGTDRYEHVRIGMNGRLDTIQTAILLEKLSIFGDEIAARDRIADRYGAALSEDVIVPRVTPGCTSVWAQYTLRLPAGQRDAVADRLRAQGIPTAIHYPKPLHRQPAFDSFPVAAGGLAVSERLAGEVLSLPMHPYLDERTQDRIVVSLRDALATVGP